MQGQLFWARATGRRKSPRFSSAPQNVQTAELEVDTSFAVCFWMVKRLFIESLGSARTADAADAERKLVGLSHRIIA